MARDRDRLRQEILERMGWNIYRIWSTDWFSDPEREMEKLLRHIRGLRESSPLP
jgi:very-short-patch-repair endonuclease